MRSKTRAWYLKLLAAATAMLVVGVWGAFVTTEAGRHILFESFSNKRNWGYLSPNILYVTASPKIDLNLVKITLKNPATTGKVVFQEKKSGWLPHRYGRDIFSVFYNGKLIGKANLFSTNSWHNHTYRFHIDMKNEKVVVRFRGEGPDGPGEFIYKEDLIKRGRI